MEQMEETLCRERHNIGILMTEGRGFSFDRGSCRVERYPESNLTCDGTCLGRRDCDVRMSRACLQIFVYES
jgi:hypothetical protein